MTNLVVEFEEGTLLDPQPDVVMPLDPTQLFHLHRILEKRLAELPMELDYDQLMDDLSC